MNITNRWIWYSGERTIKVEFVDTCVGRFECKFTKEKCNNIYRMYAKQVSIKHEGQENYVDGLSTVEFHSISNPTIFNVGDYTEPLETERTTYTLLDRFGAYKGPIINYKRFVYKSINDLINYAKGMQESDRYKKVTK